METLEKPTEQEVIEQENLDQSDENKPDEVKPVRELGVLDSSNSERVAQRGYPKATIDLYQEAATASSRLIGPGREGLSPEDVSALRQKIKQGHQAIVTSYGVANKPESNETETKTPVELGTDAMLQQEASSNAEQETK